MKFLVCGISLLFSVDDCAVAAEKVMLIAISLGIGSCYIGQGWTAFKDPFGQEILRKWDIPNGYYAVMQLLLRYPKKEDRHPEAKSKNKLVSINGDSEKPVPIYKKGHLVI